MTLRLDSQRGLSIVLAVYVALGVIYSLAAPIFEKPDEPAHFAYIKSLADGRGFPAAPVVVADGSPSQESSQPPLYYLAAALAVRLLAPDTADFAQLLVHNPAFPVVNSDVPIDNRNVFIHAMPETFPYTGTARAVHVARLVALAFGALTVWATYHLGREAFPDRAEVALLAASIVAFTPQFIFISSAINNDSAAAATSALSLWVAVRVMRLGFTPRRAIALGLLLGCAVLSKVSALALMPLALCATVAIGTSGWKDRVRYSLLAFITGAIVIGPWLIHSWLVFGDPLGTATHSLALSARPAPLGVVAALAQLPGAFVSYWLAFGWSTVLAPGWVYDVLNVVTVAGLIGAVSWSLRCWRDRRSAVTTQPSLRGTKQSPSVGPEIASQKALAMTQVEQLRSAKVRVDLAVLALLAASCLVVFVALVRWLQLHDAPLGRLLFPAISALGVLITIGWLFVARQVRWAAAVPIGLAILSAIALPATLLPAYARPSLQSLREIEQQPGQSIDVVYGEVARLIRLDVPHDTWPQPGGRLNLRLCWEPLQRDERLLMVLVQIVGAQNRVVASRRTVPGLGTYPTGSWTPGERFCDPVQVQIDSRAPAPTVYWVEVSIIDPQTDTRLPAYSVDGTLLQTNFVGRVKIAPDRYALPSIDRALDHRLGDQFELIGYDLEPALVAPGDAAVLRLYWRALRRPDHDYTVFVHVTDRDGSLLTDADSPPQSGSYPTSFWDAGEVVIDEHTITVPPLARAATYQLSVGMYTPDDGARLPVSGGISPTEIQLPTDLEIRN